MGKEFRNVFAEAEEFAYDAGRDAHVLRFGEEQYGFYAREALVLGRDVALVLNVFYRTATAEDEGCFLTLGKVYGKVIVSHHLYARFVGINFLDVAHALLVRIECTLIVVDPYANDDTVKKR